MRNRLQVNLGVFLADYHHYQVNQFLQMRAFVVPQISNAAKVRTDGPELSISAVPTRNLSQRLNLAWLDAGYRNFPNGGSSGQSFPGNDTEFAPYWHIDTGVEYHWPAEVGE